MQADSPTTAALQEEVVRLRQRVEELQQAAQTLNRRSDEYDALYETTLQLMKGLDVVEVLESILRRAGQLAGTSHGYFCLMDATGAEMTFRAKMGLFDKFHNVRIKPGEGLTGRVWQSGKPLLINDYDSWPQHLQSFIAHSIHAIVGVPLISEAQVVGVLGMAHNEPGKTFSPATVALLERFAPLAMLALENARLYSAVQEELAERTRAEAIIRAQADALLELSTPLVPISAQVVAMPLIGTIDSRRAQHIMAALLDGIGRYHASVAILDITGVQVVDSQVADIIIQAAQAVRLLGAQVVLTGIRPDMAETMVTLGIDLKGIVTRNTLQGGIAYAMQTVPTNSTAA